ncbi:hypothetical protein CXG81DRAFT_6689, partial [Caulochytrium protostelioides]
RPLRVAFIHPDLGIGGAERLVVDYAMALQARGHEVEIITSHHDPTHAYEETTDGRLRVTVYGDWLPRHLWRRGHLVCATLRSLWLAARLSGRPHAGAASYDVLVVDQISAAVPWLRMGTGAPVFFYCHFPDKLLATDRRTWWRRLYRRPLDALEAATTGAADTVAVNSAFTASVFADAFPDLAARRPPPRVLTPGLTLDAYPLPLHVVVHPAAGRPMLLSLNRFERKKHLQLAIDVLARLKDAPATGPSAAWTAWPPRLILAGGYDRRVHENREHLIELVEAARASNLTVAVRALPRDPPARANGGASAGARALDADLGLGPHRVDHVNTALPRFLAAHPDADVLLIPSFTTAERTQMLHDAMLLVYTPDREHFGIVPLEAMYSGVPVVACRSGGPMETVRHRQTGYLCDPCAAAATPAEHARSVASFADAVAAYRQLSPRERDAMRWQAHTHVRDTYAMAAIGARLDEAL